VATEESPAEPSTTAADDGGLAATGGSDDAKEFAGQIASVVQHLRLLAAAAFDADLTTDLGEACAS